MYTKRENYLPDKDTKGESDDYAGMVIVSLIWDTKIMVFGWFAFISESLC